MIAIAWVTGPLLGYAAAASAVTYGTTATSVVYAVLAVLGGLVGPAIGMVLCLRHERRDVASAFAILLVLSLGALILLVIAT